MIYYFANQDFLTMRVSVVLELLYPHFNFASAKILCNKPSFTRKNRVLIVKI